jgi:DNA-directed RNA polymerase subunit M/transcription elongation factor TFIIS
MPERCVYRTSAATHDRSQPNRAVNDDRKDSRVTTYVDALPSLPSLHSLLGPTFMLRRILNAFGTVRHCPKCGHPSGTRTLRYRSNDDLEWLQASCTRCEYSWDEECKDTSK